MVIVKAHRPWICRHLTFSRVAKWSMQRVAVVEELALAMLDWVPNRRNLRCSVALAEHLHQLHKFQDLPPRVIFGERSTVKTIIYRYTRVAVFENIIIYDD